MMAVGGDSPTGAQKRKGSGRGRYKDGQTGKDKSGGAAGDANLEAYGALP